MAGETAAPFPNVGRIDLGALLIGKRAPGGKSAAHEPLAGVGQLARQCLGQLHQLVQRGRRIEEGARVGIDLSLNRYKEVVHESVVHRAPKEILADLAKLEEEIQRGMRELERMLK